MDRFIEISLSYPVIIFSFVLCVAVIYWVVAIFGIADVESHNVDADGAFDGLGGLLMKAGLDGVPLTIAFTLVSLFAWLTIYLADIYLLGHIAPGIMLVVAGIVASVVATVAGMFVAGFLLKPMRPLFKKIGAPTAKSIIGHIATVRSGSVTDNDGVAILEDGGASMILNVRTMNGATFLRGDRVALLEYQAEKNCYIVIGEDDFNR
uniref:Transmembrane protein n=2 Tax=Pseudomonas fluorescens TaxID=294 RepID=A4V7I0_PSEFS|nr:putative transmembrane protein [Pseudomonas fluorescens SBW25]